MLSQNFYKVLLGIIIHHCPLVLDPQIAQDDVMNIGGHFLVAARRLPVPELDVREANGHNVEMAAEVAVNLWRGTFNGILGF
jgi:hypothetical protein